MTPPRLRLLAVATLVAASSVNAATATKTATGTNLADTAAGTWTGGSGTNNSPNGTDLALIDATVTSPTLTVSGPVTWNQLNFSGTGQAITLSGSQITLENGTNDGQSSGTWSLYSNTGFAVTIGNNLDFGATHGTRNTIAAAGAGILTLNGNVTATGDTTGQFLIRGGGTGILNGTITSDTQLAKVDGGTWSINSDNTGLLTGGSKIQAGTLLLGHDGALGSGTIAIDNGGAATTGTIGVVAGTGPRTLANNFAFSGAVNTLALDSTNGAITLNGNISESGAGIGSKLTVTGGNAVTLAGNNTFTGGVTLNGGGLVTISGTNAANVWTISNATYAGASGGVLITNSGAFASGSTINITSSSANFPNGFNIADDTGTVGAGSTLNVTTSGGGRASIKLGNNTTLASDIAVTGGNPLQLIVGDNAAISGNIALGNSIIGIRNDNSGVAGVSKNNTGTFTISGNISGTGNFTAPNTFTGTLVLSGDNGGYSGTIDTAGYSALVVGNNNALGTAATLTLQNGKTLAATTGSTITLANALTVSGSSTYNIGNASHTGNLALTGAVGMGGINKTFNVFSGVTLDLQGVVASDNANQALIKSGEGTLTLSGANTYTRATQITAGTLVTNNAQALGTGSIASVTVANGATLRIGNGAGSSVNTVTLGSGANLIVTDGAFIKLGALNALSLDATAGTHGVITLSGGGAYNFNGSGKLDLNGVLDGVFASGTHTYNLIVGSGSVTNNLQLANITGFDALAITLNSFTGGVLTFTAVPEPSTYGLIGAGTLAAVAMVRRRRRAA